MPHPNPFHDLLRSSQHAAILKEKEDEIKALRVTIGANQDDMEALRNQVDQLRAEVESKAQETERGSEVTTRYDENAAKVSDLEREIERLKLEAKEAVRRYEGEYKDLEKDLERTKGQLQSEIDKVRSVEERNDDLIQLNVITNNLLAGEGREENDRG